VLFRSGTAMESCGCYDHAADKANTFDDTKPKQP